jgi:uncharacterized protein YdhG (YjbR/CyaY superfamily)
MITTAPKDIDSYIAGFPKEVQALLQQLRSLIQEKAPEATECIKYGMPTFDLHGNLVHFAAFVHHIGFYSVPTAQEEFSEDLQGYKVGNGSVQFPLNQPLPTALITKIVKYRVQENLAAVSVLETN